MLVSPDGDVTVTNDGATILQKMQVEHQVRLRALCNSRDGARCCRGGPSDGTLALVASVLLSRVAGGGGSCEQGGVMCGRGSVHVVSPCGSIRVLARDWLACCLSCPLGSSWRAAEVVGPTDDDPAAVLLMVRSAGPGGTALGGAITVTRRRDRRRHYGSGCHGGSSAGEGDAHPWKASSGPAPMES